MSFRKAWGALLAVGLGLGLADGRAENCEGPLVAEARDKAALEAMLIHRCGECHRGPFLDFSKAPFFSDRFTTERALLVESLRRAKLVDDYKRMPPLNRSPLPAEELELLERYVSELK